MGSGGNVGNNGSGDDGGDDGVAVVMVAIVIVMVAVVEWLWRWWCGGMMVVGVVPVEVVKEWVICNYWQISFELI